MKTTLLLLLTAAILLSGCREKKYPTEPGVADAPLIYGNAAGESLHRAVTPHAHVAAWFNKMGMPYDSITKVELEGERGHIHAA